MITRRFCFQGVAAKLLLVALLLGLPRVAFASNSPFDFNDYDWNGCGSAVVTNNTTVAITGSRTCSDGGTVLSYTFLSGQEGQYSIDWNWEVTPGYSFWGAWLDPDPTPLYFNFDGTPSGTLSFNASVGSVLQVVVYGPDLGDPYDPAILTLSNVQIAGVPEIDGAVAPRALFVLLGLLLLIYARRRQTKPDPYNAGLQPLTLA